MADKFNFVACDAIMKTADGRFGGRMFANVDNQTGGYIELWAANLESLKALAEGLAQRVTVETGIIKV